MPIYEYGCAACGNVFEMTRPIAQSGDAADCPTCGKTSQKLVSQFASKVDYAIKGPSKAPFRGATEAAPTVPAAPAATAGVAKPAARPKATKT